MRIQLGEPVGTGISRRAFIAAVGPIGLAAASPLSLGGCGVPDDAELNRRIVASLRGCIGDAHGAGTLSARSGLDAEAALALLRAGEPAGKLYALTWNHRLMRSYVGGRRERDFAAGRTRFVDGWLLSETELAAAVLVGF